MTNVTPKHFFRHLGYGKPPLRERTINEPPLPKNPPTKKSSHSRISHYTSSEGVASFMKGYNLK